LYKNPYVCAVNYQACETDPYNSLHIFNSLGCNSGNMLFSEAIYRGIKGARRGIYTFKPKHIADADCIVISAANWINSFEDFGQLANRLEATTLPVITVGLGAQAETNRTYPTLQKGTLRLLKLLSERSTAISVRGEYSAEVLAHYGIHNAMITGCPSALLIGRKTAFINRSSIIADRGCALHASRNLFDAGNPLERYLYRQALGRQMDLVLQAEQPDIMVKLGTLPSDEEAPFHHQILTWAYGADFETTLDYLADKGRFFREYDKWITYLSTRHFAFGTRLHATIAALIAGTPATLITHDTRTAETALAMHLPTVEARDINLDRPLRLVDYYDDEKLTRFEQHYPTYRRNFEFFFHLNGLEMITPS